MINDQQSTLSYMYVYLYYEHQNKNNKIHDRCQSLLKSFQSLFDNIIYR